MIESRAVQYGLFSYCEAGGKSKFKSLLRAGVFSSWGAREYPLSHVFVMCEVYLPVSKPVKFQYGSWLQAGGRKFAPCGRFFTGLRSEEKPMITLSRRVGYYLS